VEDIANGETCSYHSGDTVDNPELCTEKCGEEQKIVLNKVIYNEKKKTLCIYLTTR
jgi:hypothetical protein